MLDTKKGNFLKLGRDGYILRYVINYMVIFSYHCIVRLGNNYLNTMVWTTVCSLIIF